MSELPAWLEKVWADAESTAIEAITECGSATWASPATGVVEAGRNLVVVSRSGAILIADNDPCAVLNRVRCERALLAGHTRWHDPTLFGTVRQVDDPLPPTWCRACTYDLTHDDDRVHPDGLIPWPCPTWRWIGYAWSHRDDYQAGWRPREVIGSDTGR